MASLRECLTRICNELEPARSQAFSNHPLAIFIRKDFQECVEQVLKDSNPDFQVKGSAGAGNWASVPWLSILDPVITTSTTEGYYVVYLFKSDGSGVYLSLNQGTTGPQKRLGAIEAEAQAQRVINSFRNNIPGIDSWLKKIHLASSTNLGASYEPSNIAARYYSSNAIPSENVLIKDLKDAITIANQARPLWKNALIKHSDVESNQGPVMGSASILPKPFLILAGISGTGKTRWVRKIAVETRNLESDRNGQANGDNFCLIPVRPDWHEPSDLLGYTSRISAEPKFIKTKFLSFLIDAWRDAWKAEASLNPRSASVANMTPYWLCLDEMNLAPVEQYFADYLSVIESRSWDADMYSCDPILSLKDRSSEEVKSIREELIGDQVQDQEMWKQFQIGSAGGEAGIPLPPNLIVVGTVNMDETTHAFSRKVLDRAFTIEFDPDDICGVYAGNAGIDPVLGVMRSEITLTAASILSTTTSGKSISEPIRSKVESLIKDWNEAMAESPFRVAFRTLNEALLYAASKGEDKMAEALDGILMMKLLPRLEGDSEKLGFDGVQKLDPVEELDKVAEAKNSLIHAAWQVASKAIGKEAWPRSKSHKKLHYMAKRLARTGYTSFWP
jgi:MrcB-like, N-terminal domain